MARILIAEDDANIFKLVNFRLKHLGHDISWASDGEQAVALVREKRPDLILLDVMMPITNGFEVLRAVKRDADTSQIPVIMVTARGQEADMSAAIRDGAHSYVVKPFNFPVLIENIKAALDQHAS